MSDFVSMKCDACRVGAPPASSDELDKFQADCPNWEKIETDGVPQIQRVYRFDTFVQALAFTNQVGNLAEEGGHHPALLTEWGRVTVRWWTHKILNLHMNDLIMAAKTDQLYAQE
jgi:4a-hydroxytetrahydrobiopterin dehydratase